MKPQTETRTLLIMLIKAPRVTDACCHIETPMLEAPMAASLDSVWLSRLQVCNDEVAALI